MTNALPAKSRFGSDFLAMALVFGLAGGLVEGAGHMVLQKLNVLENSWYQIIWIAALFNGLLLGVLGLLLPWGLACFPGRPGLRTVAVFVVALVAAVPVLALWLKEWVHVFAIFLLTVGVATMFARWFRSHEPSALHFFARSLRWVLALTVLVFSGIQGGFWLLERRGTANLPPTSASSPNILVIIIDTLRADHLSAYGYARPTSPTLDRMAAEGVLFENAFSTASYTLPSHASILNGLYPRQHGIEWDTSHGADDATFPTLPEVLQRRGYRTGGFSANRFYFGREHGFGRGFLHFEDYFQSVTDSVLRTAYGRIVALTLLGRLGLSDLGRKLASDINAAVLQWTDGPDERPFLAVINYMDVHGPYTPPQPYRSKFSRKQNPGGLLDEKKYDQPQLTPEQLQDEIDAYDGSIVYVDDYLGRLVDALERRPLSRDLLVIVTSDHGEEFGEHGGYIHDGNLYREAIHVPLIVWRPGRVPQGRRVSRPVTNAAIPATILDVLGGDAPFQGPPLQRLWEPGAQADDWPLPLADLKRRPWAPSRDPVRYGSLRSLVSPNLHYIENDARAPELFDWVRDPLEANNLASQPGQRAAIEEFRRYLK